MNTNTNSMPEISRPSFLKSFSDGNNMNGGHDWLHMRHSQSVPANYPSTMPWGQRRDAVARPCSIRPRAFTYAVRPSSPSLELDLGLAPAPRRSAQATPMVRRGVPMRRTGWGRAGPPEDEQRAPYATSSAEPAGWGLSTVDPVTYHIALSNVSALAEEADVEDNDYSSGEEDHEPVTWSFRPPGLSTPVPWINDEIEDEMDMATPRASLLTPAARLARQHQQEYFPLVPEADEPAQLADVIETPSAGPLRTPTRPTRSRARTGLPAQEADHNWGPLPIMSRWATTEHFRF